MLTLVRICSALIWVGVFAWSVRGEPVINELLASNHSIHPDNSDFDDYSDWIELYNPAATEVALSNHFLTDDLTQPLKWQIPDGALIPANGYLVLRADGFDAAPGETYLRGYYPWSSTFQTRWYHVGFKLSANGEEVGLYRAQSPPEEVTLIPSGAVWKYLDTGEDPGPDWMTLTYTDGSWLEGAAELGYGDGDEATVVSYGPDKNHKHPTTYFRRHFAVTDPSQLGSVRFRVVIDDGAIIYLNGEEVARLRMSDGVVGFGDYASSTVSKEHVFEPVELSKNLLRAGDNVLAVEVHQASARSSDISFNAELLASEIVGQLELVDSVTFGAQTTDVSYGRDPGATNGWSFFGEPTPARANTTTPLTQLTRAGALSASLDSGFHPAGQSVTMASSDPNAIIHYTLDGSVPTSASPVYSNALTITQTTILRARGFVPGLIPGPILTRSFLVDEFSERTLPVISLVADPATLFDDQIGIYENDSAYPYKGREVPARIEFFEPDEAQAVAFSVGARIAGENIWRYAQKPLNLYARSKYGDDVIAHQIFPGEPVATFGELNVRNGGDNWAKAMLRDAMMPSVLRGRVENDLASYRPCVLFLNGQYWGIYNLRKRFDEVFFANEHRLTEDAYDLVQYAHNERGVLTLMADTGTTETYEAFKEFFTTNDLAEPANYVEVTNQMNIDSFVDYVVVNDFVMNTSWSHNREFWRARTPDAKWQWNVPDLDRGLNSPNLTGSLIDNFRSSYALFRALDDNTNFVNRLIQRYAAHLGSTFHPDRISDILDGLAAEVDGEIDRHIARWRSKGGMPSRSSRQAELDEIKQFAVERPAHAVSRLLKELNLNLEMAELTVGIQPSGAGQVRVAGVPMAPEYATTVSLFQDTPVELTAEAAPGYEFVGWSTGTNNPTLVLNLSGPATITAIFQPGTETVLPPSITTDTTLTATEAPYALNGDLVVEPDVTLTLDPGVTLRVPAGADIRVHGRLMVNGTTGEPVEIHGRAGRSWGNLSFVSATGESVLSHLTLRDATLSRRDPLNLKAAVSAIDSSITLDHTDIEAALPVFARGGSTTLRHCRIHSLFTGDGINVKSGLGRVEDCTFTGEATPDTDAVDFDNVVNGVIQGNRIYAFRGFNSDAIDVGEGCVDLLVVSNRIFNITDKGVSVGQGSTAWIQRNLIVNCDMGVGIKDTGSTGHIDQNTFAQNNRGVAAYEKNAGHGGGIAFISNCIFSRSKDKPVFVDALSHLTVDYSLSDTLSLPGTGNLLADPRFNDAADYDFSLAADSPAINAGDPAHATDTDGSRADMGAYYVHDPADYPYLIPNIIVINEVLAHSHDVAPDWIELLNNSSQDLDLSGWYLSDDPDVPMKYRIAEGTIIPGNGYLVFHEDLNFGLASSDPGALIPFALSENGDTVHVFGPTDGLRPDYHETETFGPSLRGVSRGRYYKQSTRTFNFVAMATPTPGAPNSEPLTGPIVISEIMYHPPNGEAEYIELANIDSAPVALFDAETGESWRMTKGLHHVFPAADPIVMAPGERIVLTRNITAFNQEYGVPSGTRLFQWDSGALNNGGETLELSQPGDVDELGIRQFIRVDRVDFSDSGYWPISADGAGDALLRLDERAYGNDPANWTATSPSPGQTGFQRWAAGFSLPAGQDAPDDDPDEDGVVNAVEYATGTNPLVKSSLAWDLTVQPGSIQISFVVSADRPEIGYEIQKAQTPDFLTWIPLEGFLTTGEGNTVVFRALDPAPAGQGYYRLVIALPNSR